MAIRHVMKDGAELDDIRGKVIKYAEARAVYEVIRGKRKWQELFKKSKSTDRN